MLNHKILLEKLELFGVVGKCKTLIEFCLTCRYQGVALGNITSNWEVINCGVP
jgi:hypothetical protein